VIRRFKSNKGFTLIELVVVVAIIIVITALSLPSLLNSMATIRLRSAAQNLAGILQQARVRATHDNAVVGLGCTPFNVAIDTCTQTFLVDKAGNQLTNPVQIQLPQNVSYTTSPPATISDAAVGFTKTTAPGAQPFFNARGVPCQFNAGTCQTTVAGGGNANFVFYLTGPSGLAAVSVSPAGRVKVWSYSSSKWQ
jgi:prepilin-type N-terminal cleavage/methylation domain-containing protein